MNEGRRVLVIGLDGATFDLIKPWVAGGELPTLARLMREGASGQLLSTFNPTSAVAWPSFATGKYPGKHGIFGFRSMKAHSYELKFSNARSCQARTVWKLLSKNGKRVIVVNLPMTYPPEEVNGILVSGMDAPGIESHFTYPLELRSELLREFPSYRISLHLMGYLSSHRRRKRALVDILSIEETRKRAVLYLAKKYPWDFLAVRFNAPDNVQHHFWQYMDPRHPDHDPNADGGLREAILRVHQHLDEMIAELLHELQDDRTIVIIISDHGFGPRLPRKIYLNEWLKRRGLLTPMRRDGTPGHGQFPGQLAHILIQGLLPLATKLLGHRSKDRLKRLLPGLVSRVVSEMRFRGINWNETRAFLSEGFSIRINLKGREAKGVVERGREYEDLREMIKRELLALKDPDTNEALFAGIYTREEIYHGPFVDQAPDLLLSPTSICNASPGFFRRPRESIVVHERHWRKTSGGHRREGIVIMGGDGVRSGVELQDCSIVSLAPTILYVLGCPIPDDMDGGVLTECIDQGYLEANPIRFDQVAHDGRVTPSGDEEIYSAEEAERIQDQLRGLGYIE